MNTDSQRKAARDYHAKREAEGLKKVTLWLSPAARFKLDALKAAAGSKDKAADAAIMAWQGPVIYDVVDPGADETSGFSAARVTTKFAGRTALGEPLPERGAYQKKGKKP